MTPYTIMNILLTLFNIGILYAMKRLIDKCTESHIELRKALERERESK